MDKESFWDIEKPEELSEDWKKAQEFQDEKNQSRTQEQGTASQAEAEKPAEPEVGHAEPDFEEAFLAGGDNRGRFEKLSDNAKNFASGLYERAKMDIIDRAKVAFNDRLFDWHNEKAVKLKFELEEKQKDIRRLEELKAGHSGRIEAIQKELGPISPKLKAKAELEKEEIQRNIDKEKLKMGDLDWELYYQNEKKSVYETKRNRICENALEKVGERLTPYEEKLERLKNDKEQLGNEIKSFRGKNKEFSERAKDLENRMKAAPLKIERKIYRSYIKAFEKNIKENNKLIDKTINKEAKIGHQVAKFEKKAMPWRSKKSEFERIMKQGKSENIAAVGAPEPVRTVEAPRTDFESVLAPAERGGEKPKESEIEVPAFPEESAGTEVVKEQAEKAEWSSISNKERKFWIDKMGRGIAKDLFKEYNGDFEDLAKYRKSHKKNVKEWKKIKKEEI